MLFVQPNLSAEFSRLDHPIAAEFLTDDFAGEKTLANTTRREVESLGQILDGVKFWFD